MTSNYIAALVDEDRHGPTPFPDRGGDLRDLFGTVRPGIAGIRHQGGHRPAFDRISRPRVAGLSGYRGGFLAHQAAFGLLAVNASLLRLPALHSLFCGYTDGRK